MKPFFLVTWTLQIIQFIRYLIQMDRSKQLLLLFLFFLCFLQFYNFVKWKLDLRNHKISIRSLFHLEKFVLRCPASDPVRVSWCENLLLPSKWRHIGIQRIWSGQNARRRRGRHRLAGCIRPGSSYTKASAAAAAAAACVARDGTTLSYTSSMLHR